MWSRKLCIATINHGFQSAQASFVKCFGTVSNIQLDTVCRRSIPGLNSAKKLWWAKEITPDLHVAGGLTERQIKYAYDSGFRSVLSLYAESNPGNFGGEPLASETEAKFIAKIAGFQFDTVLGEGEEWISVKAIEKVSESISRMQKPILLYSIQPEAIAFLTLMHLANLSKHNKSYLPRVNSDRVYKMGAIMGMDFTSERIKSLVSEITDEQETEKPPKPITDLVNWLSYWLAHPLYKNWFTAGQIRRGHLKEIEKAGFKSVINMRQGMTLNGKPSQESITLINVKDTQETYDKDFKPLRQLDSTLETLMIDPKRDKTYISPTSNVRYESRNAGEYGDDIGNNEEIERKHFQETSPLKYYHLPLDLFVTYTPEVFQEYKDSLLEIGKDGPVLFHCAIGKRAAFMGTLAAALQYEKDLNWALQRVNELGFEVSETSGFTDVYSMYKGWLSSARK